MLASQHSAHGTAPSQDGDRPGSAELRASPRVGLMLRQAKIVGAAGESLCLVRDVSSTGASVRLFHPLPRGSSDYTIEIYEGEPLSIERVWERAGLAGFRFRQSIDVDAIVHHRPRFAPRRLRIALDCGARIASGDVWTEATIANLSQQGACVFCEGDFVRDQLIRVEIGDLPALYAKVRWHREDRVGLVFEQHFELRDFACMVARLQNIA